MDTFEVRTMSVAELEPAAYNPRIPMSPGTHDYEALKRSLDRFGVVDPLIWNQRTGRLVGGHQRLRVLRDLGREEVPVSVVDLDEGDEKALNIALNRISGEWDEEKLRELLADLEAMDYDLEFTGVSVEDLNELLEGATEEELPPEEDPDTVIEPPTEVKTKVGDLWILGDHRLLCGDSTDREAWARLMDGEKAACLCTDPPYNVGKSYANEDLSDAAMADFYRGWMEAARAMMAEGSRAFVYSSVKKLPQSLQAFCENFNYQRMVVWYKSDAQSQFEREWFWHWEPIFCGFVGESPRSHEGRGRVGNLHFSRDHWTCSISAVKTGGAEAVDHPTQKPTKIVEEPIWIGTEEGEIVIEPFVGSGTTIVAAERLKRRCFGIELDPKFVEVTVARWEKYSGKKAERFGASGEKYHDELREEDIPF